MNNTKIKTDTNFEIISFEKCIVCDKETNILKNLNVDYRQFYIKGAGQLCNSCYANLDNRKYIKL